MRDGEKGRVLVSQIVESQYERGPDFQQVEPITRLGAHSLTFGHNRLSIIDTTAASNQPLWNQDRTCCVCFNGEIYNFIELRTELRELGYEFRTSGDVEVLLTAYEAWGLEFASHLNGMFALAISDQRHQRLVVVRDRFGVKPLYYRLQPGEFAFASTPTVLARHYGCRPNLSYLQKGIKYRVYEDDSEETQYDGIKNLPGGMMMVVQPDGDGLAVTTSRYYDLKARVSNTIEDIRGESEARLTDLLLETLRSAVMFRMRADVPVALSVSGGLDSSSIAAVVSKEGLTVHGYAYGDPTDARTEGPIVKLLSERLGYPVHYITAGSNDFISALDSIFRAQDAPFMTASILAQQLVYRRAKGDGIKVLLGGQGGDEALMGYRKYMLFMFQRLMKQGNYLGAATQLFQSTVALLGEVGSWKAYLTRRRAYEKGSDAVAGRIQIDAETPELQLGHSPSDPLWHRQVGDILRFSLPTLLRYEDRNSMSQSIESRLPYMDYRLIELGLALPEGLKVSHGYGKYIMRKALVHHLPPEIRLNRRKMGFDVILDDVVSKGLGQHIRDQLQTRSEVYSSVLRHKVDIATQFTDESLARQGEAFGDAMTLLWLGERLA